MKKYYTVVQPFSLSDIPDRDLCRHLTAQGISYKLGADFGLEFIPLGKDDYRMEPERIFKKCVILAEEYELSALKLVFDDIYIVKNRNWIQFLNFLRTLIDRIF